MSPSKKTITANLATLFASLDDPGSDFEPSIGSVPAEDFNAPAGTVLAPNTTYWVVVNEAVTDVVDMVAFASTSSTGEDTNGLAGWSIGDGHQNKSGTSWSSKTDRTLRLKLRGHENPILPKLTMSPTPPQTKDRILNSP